MALRVRRCMLFVTLLSMTGLLTAARLPVQADSSALAGAVVLVIRHAEKPTAGVGLSPAGERHAAAYVSYFGAYRVDGRVFHPTHLFAAADTARSHRPFLTLAPVSAALHLPIDQRFRDKDTDKFAVDLQTHAYGKRLLICWHHGELPALLTALGASPATLLPGGTWPDTQFGWVIELHYDAQGKVVPSLSHCLVQRLAF